MEDGWIVFWELPVLRNGSLMALLRLFMDEAAIAQNKFKVLHCHTQWLTVATRTTKVSFWFQLI